MVGDKKEKVEVYVCPNCRSNEVGYVFKLGNLFGVLPKMRCKKCGYEDSIFPMWVIDKKKLEEANKKNEKSASKSKNTKKSKKVKKKGGKK